MYIYLFSIYEGDSEGEKGEGKKLLGNEMDQKKFFLSIKE